MLFNSYAFLLLFLPLTLGVFYALLLRRGVQPAILSLLVCSLVFYAWWDITNLPLLLSSIGVNFLIARRMVSFEGKARKQWFALGVVFNLVLLGYFKYAGFITTNLQALSESVPSITIALPLAISFFTFQQISFLRGVYEHRDYVPRFVRYATFISFFPHLIAGPILHHKDIQPQLSELKREVPWRSITLGIALFTLGLFKKVMIADPIGMLADPLYAQAEAGAGFHAITAWSAAFLYGFQLYFDFSGYSDMAIGLAHLFGIRFPQNFASPYRATSIAEFWRRWHITLSQFLREFLYIPLGGNRRGLPRTLCNLTVTMALGGLWHGASWNFVLWGLLHGFMLAVHALWQRMGYRLPQAAAWGLTLACIMAAWILFRAPDLASASALYAGLFTLPDAAALAAVADAKPLLDGFGWIAGSVLLCLLLPNSVAWVRDGEAPFGKARFAFSTQLWCFGLLFVLFMVAFAHLSRLSIFLYFNF